MRAVPRIRTKYITAADLMRRIIKEIEAEPRRLNMRWWISMFNGRRRRQGAYVDEEPACGTVCCFAGWGATLLRKPHETVKDSTAEKVMTKLLGHDVETKVWDSVTGGYVPKRDWTVDSLFFAGLSSQKAGTRGHVRDVVRYAKKYLKDHPELETRVIDVEKKKIVKEGSDEGNRLRAAA